MKKVQSNLNAAALPMADLTDGRGGGGARTTIKCNWAKSSSWEGEKEVEDGMIAVSTRCNTVLDASENKGLPGVEPLLSPRAMDFFGGGLLVLL